ncbi:MAG TPA: glycosyltransferase family 87 protein [Tepidisphaeraceae bacterium]|jgi:hypothetical protein|nr:glycosyltransferase family 87 protein [Tepidisphaeraceae bacterium]
MSQFAGASEELARSSLRPRLWKLGICLLVFLTSVIASSKFLGPQTDLIGSPGSDLIPSYMAGTFVRIGHADWLMDSARQVVFQHQLRESLHLDPNRHFGPWLNPPYYAWIFVPLSALPFHEALATWFEINLLLTAGAVALLASMFPGGSGWRTWGLIPLLLVCSFPFLQVIASEQNTCLSLFLVCATVACWRKQRGLAAGLIAGLLLFKPQLAAVLIAALCWSMGWRAILGVATTAFGLLAATTITMPGALREYLTRLPAVLPWLSAGGTYLWERQITWQGFWRFALQHHATGPAPLAVRVLWPIGAITIGALLAWTVIRAKRTGGAHGDRLIAAMIGAMPLVMPYYMDYDLLLLAVPAVLLAAEACGEGGLDPIGKGLRLAWMALYAWLFFNATFADITHFDITVPALSIMAISQCLRVLRPALAIAEAQPVSPMIAKFRAALAHMADRAA